MSRIWALNLDAELELEQGARYTPSREVEARVASLAEQVARTLEPGDRQVGEAPASGLAPRAWCPTPRALAALSRAGAPMLDAPPLEVLRVVNERGFAAALAEGELPGCLRATELDAVVAHVARPGPTGEWLLKRGYGVAGRGQRPLHPGEVSAADRAWIAASLRRGALYVEPRVDIARELSVHGWALDDGPEVRSIREQRVRERAWTGSSLARDLPASLEAALVDVAERAGRALVGAGYRGPFGVDAYLWRAPSGALAVRALSEINARYCMGWDARDGWDPPGASW